MANCCQFEMEILGDSRNINRFLDALAQKGTNVIGRGAIFSEPYITDNCDGRLRANIEGDTAWSLESSLFYDAEKMKEQKKMGEGLYNDEFIKSHEFLNLSEASEIFNLTLEAFSWELGMEFSEHIVIDHGRVIENDSVDYQEFWTDDYDSFEEFLEEYPGEVTEEEFNETPVFYIGGFNPTFTI